MRNTIYTLECFSGGTYGWGTASGIVARTKAGLFKKVGKLTMYDVKRYSKFRVVKTVSVITKESPMKFHEFHSKITKEHKHA